MTAPRGFAYLRPASVGPSSEEARYHADERDNHTHGASLINAEGASVGRKSEGRNASRKCVQTHRESASRKCVPYAGHNSPPVFGFRKIPQSRVKALRVWAVTDGTGHNA